MTDVAAEFVSDPEIHTLAETFVAGLGSTNRELMLANLAYVTLASDGLRALQAALVDACTADRLAALENP
jgi:hypothetical protein